MQLEVQYSYIKHTSAAAYTIPLTFVYILYSLCINYYLYAQKTYTLQRLYQFPNYSYIARYILAISYLPSLTADQLLATQHRSGPQVFCSYSLQLHIIFMYKKHSYIQRPFQLTSSCIQVLQLQFLTALVAQKTYISSFISRFQFELCTSFVATVCTTYIFCSISLVSYVSQEFDVRCSYIFFCTFIIIQNFDLHNL